MKLNIAKNKHEREKKIAHVTDKSTHLGVVRLGIPRGFSINDIEGIWGLLQQPNITPEWT